MDEADFMGTPTPGRHSGRVVFITGASRGIGKAVALRMAAEGARIVVAAKTTDASERTPGTIYETVAEVEALGSEALAVRCDVRSEEDVQAAVAAAIDRFGRIDVLFNNAGAIQLAPVLTMPLKRFDLVHAVNFRGPFMLSQAVLPHMIDQGAGHIVMFSPPLRSEASPGMAPYMASKYAMTRLALSIAAEHAADGVAANAIWPRTMIETLAVIHNELGDRSQWRTPEIICDAFSELISRDPRTNTGRALLDEEILAEAGVTDFDRYWALGEPPAHIVEIAGSESVLR